MEYVFLPASRPDALVTGVRLVLSLSRGVLMDVRASGPLQDRTLLEKHLTQHQVELRWNLPINDCLEGLMIHIQVAGEPPCLKRWIWLEQAARARQELGPTVGLPDPKKVAHLDDEVLSQLSTSDRMLLARRCAILETSSPKIRLYQQYFFELDCQTNPMLIGHSDRIPERERVQRSTTIQGAAQVLMLGMQQRLQGPMPDTPHSPSPLERGTLRYLSTIQVAVIRSYFSNGRGRVEVGELGEAYDLFFNGGLRVESYAESWNGEPDSAYSFLFGEFALQAVRHDIDRDVWEPLLPVLVRGQEIFRSAYRPEDLGRPPCFDDYRSGNWCCEHALDPEAITALRAYYSDRSVEWLHTRITHNLREACPGGFTPPGFPAVGGEPSGM